MVSVPISSGTSTRRSSSSPSRACTRASTSTAAAAPRSPSATSYRAAGSSRTPSSATSSITTGDCGVPPPRHPGTTPSSSATTPTTAPERGAPPAGGRPQRTMARTTPLDTLRCSPSFGGGGNLSSAKAARTISSTLDDLQLDITLLTHRRNCEYLPLALPPLSPRIRRDARAYSVEKKREKR